MPCVLGDQSKEKQASSIVQSGTESVALRKVRIESLHMFCDTGSPGEEGGIDGTWGQISHQGFLMLRCTLVPVRKAPLLLSVLHAVVY